MTGPVAGFPIGHHATVALPFNQYPLVAQSPAQLGSLVAWWDVSQEVGLTNGQGVNTLTDRSGNGLTLTAIDPQGQPVYVTNKFNGLPAIRFQTVLDAGGDHMYAMQTAGALSRVYPFSVGFVASRKGGRPPRALFEWDEFVLYLASQTAGDRWGLFGSDGGAYLPTDDSPHAGILVGTSLVSGDYVLDGQTVHRTVMPAASAFRTAPKATLGSYDYPDTVGQTFDIAHDQNYHGHFGELALFSRALNPTERLALHLYYKTKWGTGLYAPSYDANAPTTVAGLVAWYKADALVGFADGAAVGAWPDASGNGHAMAQAVGANKPLYRVGGVNGLPGVSFHEGAAASFLTFSLGNLAQPYTVVLVLAFDATFERNAFHAQGVSLAATPSGGDDFDGVLFSTAADNAAVYQNTVNIVYSGADTRDYYNGHVHTACFNGAASYGRRDGVQTGGAFNSRLATDPWHLGSDHLGAQPAQIIVAELLFYNRALTGTELATVEGYLKAKWGTP